MTNRLQPSPEGSRRGRVAARSQVYAGCVNLPALAAGWGIMANEIARGLRKRMTPQEVKLWAHLRSWRTRGFNEIDGNLEGVLTLIDHALRKPPTGLATLGHPRPY